MPTDQTDKDRRDALLDDLKQATEEWYASEEQKIDDEVEFLKSVMRGRTGSERLARENTQQGQILVANDINSFLAGSG